MLRSGLSALSDRVDSKFLTAYWLPAFVAVLGGTLILAQLLGWDRMETWIGDLDSAEQSIGAILVLLQITMIAFILRALTQVIVEFFSGTAMPRTLAEWSTEGQRRAKAATTRMLGGNLLRADSAPLSRPAAQRLNQLFPMEDADLQPTSFGNVMARAGEHPRIAYAMEGNLWWPRLAPLLPSYFQDILGGGQAPLMALLNLSVVFAGLALFGFAVLGVIGRSWIAAIVCLIGGGVLSRLCYRAAISQAVTTATMLEVAFDLFRYEILKQLDVDVPADLTAERELWQRLSRQLLDLPPALKRDDAQPAPAP